MQCDALCNVLLGNLGSLVINKGVTLTTHLNTVAEKEHPFTATLLPKGNDPFQQNIVPCHTAKIVQEWFGDKESKVA